MGVDYGNEKFFSVLSYAVGSTDSVQERLSNVISGVCHLERDSFPDDDTWQRFEALLAETTKRAAKGDEGTIAATTSQMSEDEAAKWLHEALSIFTEIAEAYGRARPV